MKKNIFLVTSALALLSMGVTSCDTPTGQGAGWGAVTASSALLLRATHAVLPLAL